MLRTLLEIEKNTKITSLFDIESLNKAFIELIMRTAKDFKEGKKEVDMSDKTLALMFCENSTRTKLSFEMSAKSAFVLFLS